MFVLNPKNLITVKHIEEDSYSCEGHKIGLSACFSNQHLSESQGPRNETTSVFTCFFRLVDIPFWGLFMIH